MSAALRHRFPQLVYGHGTEPDPRLSLANERTLLAWIRTSLALVAGGIALLVIDIPLLPAARSVAAIMLLACGCLLPWCGWIHWVRVERAMRLQRVLPAPAVALPVVVLISVVCIVVAWGWFAA